MLAFHDRMVIKYCVTSQIRTFSCYPAPLALADPPFPAVIYQNNLFPVAMNYLQWTLHNQLNHWFTTITKPNLLIHWFTTTTKPKPCLTAGQDSHLRDPVVLVLYYSFKAMLVFTTPYFASTTIRTSREIGGSRWTCSRGTKNRGCLDVVLLPLEKALKKCNSEGYGRGIEGERMYYGCKNRDVQYCDTVHFVPVK